MPTTSTEYIRGQHQDRPSDHSTTVWLTSPNLKVKDDQLPSSMGWVSLGILDPQKQRELREEDDRWVIIKRERADTRQRALAEAMLAQQKKRGNAITAKTEGAKRNESRRRNEKRR